MCLYNGAIGTVVDVVYLDGRRPGDDPPPQPDFVLVQFFLKIIQQSSQLHRLVD